MNDDYYYNDDSLQKLKTIVVFCLVKVIVTPASLSIWWLPKGNSSDDIIHLLIVLVSTRTYRTSGWYVGRNWNPLTRVLYFNWTICSLMIDSWPFQLYSFSSELTFYCSSYCKSKFAILIMDRSEHCNLIQIDNWTTAMNAIVVFFHLTKTINLVQCQVH